MCASAWLRFVGEVALDRVFVTTAREIETKKAASDCSRRPKSRMKMRCRLGVSLDVHTRVEAQANVLACTQTTHPEWRARGCAFLP